MNTTIDSREAIERQEFLIRNYKLLYEQAKRWKRINHMIKYREELMKLGITLELDPLILRARFD